MRRPGIVAAAAAALLLVIAIPATGLHWTGVDAKVLPQSKSARVVADAIERDFPGADETPINVAVTAPASAAPELANYAGELRRIDGVRLVTPPRQIGAGTWQIDVHTGTPSAGEVSQRAVVDVRAVPQPFHTKVGGAAAASHDQRAAVSRMLPLALAILVVLTLTVLWVMTGSVVLPVKTLLMNLLTTAAATGLVVFVFQDGHLSNLVGSSAQSGIEQTDFLVLVAIVFGLSTDYGVFLLTRIKEARDRGLPDREAIAVGIQRTGAIVTAAAVLLAVALGAFATAHLVFLKELGVGAAAAVLMDAFIVRALLVPALMGLLGRANWWSPRPLRRAHERLGIAESDPAPA
jgi:RND superfamily putative drug exporter